MPQILTHSLGAAVNMSNSGGGFSVLTPFPSLVWEVHLSLRRLPCVFVSFIDLVPIRVLGCAYIVPGWNTLGVHHTAVAFERCQLKSSNSFESSWTIPKVGIQTARGRPS